MGELATVKPVNVLATIDRARQMLAAVRTVPEAVELRDMLSAFLEVKKRCESSHEVRNLAAEIKIRCERKLGEMLKEMPREQGQRNDTTSLHDVTKLQQTKLNRVDQMRFQRIASIPEGEFDSYVQTVMDEGLELTTAGTLRLWKSLQDDTPAEKQFLPHVEFEAIAGWLRARRETWPDEMKPHFKKFMTNLVGQLEEPSEDD